MTSPSQRDELLARLLDQLTEQQHSGEAVELDQVAQQYPELKEELRELWGAVMMADAVALRAETSAVDPENSTEFQANRDCAGSDPEINLPARFGDYELLEKLGSGGMGIVYRARQISLDRIVAVKVLLRGEFASAAEQIRFRSEAEAVARLEHPAIVPIYEVGQQEGRAYFSMKYIDGQTLAARLIEGPLPARQAAQILQSITEAIHYSHQQGVLHRDLKPANILLSTSGEVYVTDFGLAKRVGGDASLTATGAVLGTPSYMAPEQAAGSRGRIGPACDIYSLGTILYAMITGRPPFQAASPIDTVLMVLEQDPPLPRILNPKADHDLEMIALRCLQKPPELRYRSAEELGADLSAYLSGESISARSGNFSQVVARMFRETHHATVLENWGLLWMWHALVLLVLCLTTNWFHWMKIESAVPYVALWGIGLAIWAPIFWALRRRGGPVTAVERQIAHVWGGSVICAILLFVIESILRLPVLSLSPVLGLTSGMVFMAKAGILSGTFYIYAFVMFLTAIAMALLQQAGIDLGITLFGITSALTFFLPGLKYYRQSMRSSAE